MEDFCEYIFNKYILINFAEANQNSRNLEKIGMLCFGVRGLTFLFLSFNRKAAHDDEI